MEPDQKRYPHNVLEGFANGCLLDLRVRIAVDLLRHSTLFAPMIGQINTPEDKVFGHAVLRFTALEAAQLALDTATELLRLAEARGLIEPIPEHTELNAPLLKQARRTATYSIEQQLEGARRAREEQSNITTMGPVTLVPPHGH